MTKYYDPSTRRFRRNTDNHISPEFKGIGWKELSELARGTYDTPANHEYNARLDYALEQSQAFRDYDNALFKTEQVETREKFERKNTWTTLGIWVVGMSLTFAAILWTMTTIAGA